MVQKGDVPITIKWTLNSRPIINGEEGITILKLSPKTSVLNIAAVEQDHRGVFKCIAENKAGSSFTTSELKVNGTWTQGPHSKLLYYYFLIIILFTLILFTPFEIFSTSPCPAIQFRQRSL